MSALTKIPTQSENIGDQSSLSNNNRELVPLDNRSQALNQIFASFNQTFQSLPEALKKASPFEYSLVVKKYEEFLIEAEEISTDEQIVKMRKQFEELVKKMPQGPSILLQRDIDKIMKLSQIPANEKYDSKCGKYYEPKTCPMEIISHFQNFCDRNGYPGTSVSMKRDDFYGGYENRMMTLVGFIYKEISPSKLNAFINQFFAQKEEDINKLKVSLERLASKKVMDWGFENFEVIFPEDMHGTIKQRLQNENKYRCHIIFFHKKVGNEMQDGLTKVREIQDTYAVDLIKNDNQASHENPKQTDISNQN